MIYLRLIIVFVFFLSLDFFLGFNFIISEAFAATIEPDQAIIDQPVLRNDAEKIRQIYSNPTLSEMVSHATKLSSEEAISHFDEIRDHLEGEADDTIVDRLQAIDESDANADVKEQQKHQARSFLENETKENKERFDANVENALTQTRR